MGIFEQASTRPGIRLDQITASSAVLTGARRVGLVQAATVRSSQGSRSRTYVFSPLMQAADDGVATTEALHLRKLFVAHILFGQEEAVPWGGQINNPTVLVRKLLDRGRGSGRRPTSARTTTCSRGAASYASPASDAGMAYLRVLKKSGRVVEGGLDWLKARLRRHPRHGIRIGAAASRPGVLHQPRG